MSSTSKKEKQLVNDGLMDLLASKIDYLEGKGKTTAQQQGQNGGPTDEFDLSPTELADVAAREAHIRSLLLPLLTTSTTTDTEENNTDTTTTTTATSTNATNIQVVIDLFTAECRAHIAAQNHGNLYRDRYARCMKQKDRLESLCREMTNKNKILQEELKTVTIQQQKQHQELKTKFEGSLSDISEQLKKHTEDRIKQHEDNDKLRENLNQLLKYESVREDHFNHQLRTKELEHQLMEAKMRQQMEFAAQECKKVQQSEERILQLQEIEITLRSQLQGYADKFTQVQTTLSKSNELFATFKAEMEKMSKQMKKLEKEKKIAETKNNESQLTIIQMFEERTSDRKLLDKYQRQKDKLQSLCLEYEKDKKHTKLLLNSLHQQSGGAAGAGAGIGDEISISGIESQPSTPTAASSTSTLASPGTATTQLDSSSDNNSTIVTATS